MLPSAIGAKVNTCIGRYRGRSLKDAILWDDLATENNIPKHSV